MSEQQPLFDVAERPASKVRYVYIVGPRRFTFEFPLVNEQSLTPRRVECFYRLQVENIRGAMKSVNIALCRALIDYTRDSIPAYLETVEMPEGFTGSQEERECAEILDFIMLNKIPRVPQPYKRNKRARIADQHLYFLVAGDVLKVGKSINVPERLSVLRKSMNLPFEIYRQIDFAGHRERRVHADLGQYWIEGSPSRNGQSTECFRWCDETKAYIDRLIDHEVVNA